MSSAKGKEVKLERPLFIGEVGLTGEVRPISHIDKLVNEGIKMGFKNIIMPLRNKEKIENKKINIIGISNVREVINKVF